MGLSMAFFLERGRCGYGRGLGLLSMQRGGDRLKRPVILVCFAFFIRNLLIFYPKKAPREPITSVLSTTR